MRSIDWLQLGLFVAALALITKPMGLYLMQVLDAKGRTWLDPILKPLERVTYRVMGVKPDQEQDWKQYTFAMLLFSLVSCLFTYAILRLQHLLPLNPQGFGALSPDLAFNTAISFTTNTTGRATPANPPCPISRRWWRWSFTTSPRPPPGIALAAALVRGSPGIPPRPWATSGSIWCARSTTCCCPSAWCSRSFLVSQGMIQNFKPYTKAKLMEPYTMQVAKTDAKGQPVTTNVAVMVQAPKLDAQGQPLMTNGVAMMMDVPKLDDKGQPVMTNMPVMVDQKVEEQAIAQGPMASQVAIKMLGTNGGGYTNANAAHPFENPTPLSNFLQMLSIFAIGSGLTYYLGRMVKNQAHGWSVWAAMMALFLAGLFLCWYSEAAGQPDSSPAWRGRRGRQHGRQGSPLRHLQFRPVRHHHHGRLLRRGQLHARLLHGAGRLCAALQYPAGRNHLRRRGRRALRHARLRGAGGFIAGLMVGRTPEYLGKKIQSYDVKMAMLALLVLALSILGFAAWASVSKWGLAGLNNNGPHGLSEILYAYSSANGNNGSAFAGFNANTPWYNTTMGLAMLVGRFLMIVPIMALAGSLGQKRIAPPSAGTFPVSGLTFVVLLLGTVLLVGALNFLPGADPRPRSSSTSSRLQGKLF